MRGRRWVRLAKLWGATCVPKHAFVPFTERAESEGGGMGSRDPSLAGGHSGGRYFLGSEQNISKVRGQSVEKQIENEEGVNGGQQEKALEGGRGLLRRKHIIVCNVIGQL